MRDSYVGDCMCENGTLLGQPFDGPHPERPWQIVKRRSCACPSDINTTLDNLRWSGKSFSINCKCPNNNTIINVNYNPNQFGSGSVPNERC